MMLMITTATTVAVAADTTAHAPSTCRSAGAMIAPTAPDRDRPGSAHAASAAAISTAGRGSAMTPSGRHAAQVGRPPRITPPRGRLGVALALAIGATLVGCAGNGTSSDRGADGSDATASATPSGRDGLALARKAYSLGAWNEAYTEADAVRRTARNPLLRDEAAYLAGLAAYRLGDAANAERLLTPLVNNPDDQLAANASATLGLLALSRNQLELAVERFQAAQKGLTGQDRAEAAYHAGLAHQRLGQAGQARTQFILARAASDDQDFLARVGAELESTGFTLQLGAFSSVENAERFAASLADSPVTRRLGEPRIVAQEQADGGTLYLVRVGRFSSLQSAISTRDTLAIRPALVTPMTGDGEGEALPPSGR